MQLEAENTEPITFLAQRSSTNKPLDEERYLKAEKFVRESGSLEELIFGWVGGKQSICMCDGCIRSRRVDQQSNTQELSAPSGGDFALQNRG